MADLQIVANSTAIQRNTKTYYHVFGGEPTIDVFGHPIYRVAIKDGGAGGSISSREYFGGTSGIYTSPPNVGRDILIATDSAGNTKELEINTLSPIGLLADIIKTEMSLENDQVFLYNQEFNIPPDERLYVILRAASVKPFSNNNEHEPNGDNVDSIQFASFSSLIDITLMSKSDEALLRKEEVILALNSDYSLSQQDANLIYVPKLPTQFVDVPDIEGGGRLFRYVITLNIHYTESKILKSKFYDKFENVQVAYRNSLITIPINDEG